MQTCHSHCHSSAVVFSADKTKCGDFNLNVQLNLSTKETDLNGNMPFFKKFLCSQEINENKCKITSNKWTLLQCRK
jgi:hypothetical protein